ncbi:MAG: sigma-54 dependent transcriptional regulator [Acidobacteriia bacterium]|nr:sigma-54 dependent transcriptional regulator [Terriglobia bacterium]
MNAKASILIVDDETVVRDSLSKWFEEEGYSVETASTAREALLKLPTEHWDLSLVDIKMPGMDGLELQRKIREVNPETIVIIMTGYASVETAVQALKDGAYDYITKPFDPDDLAHVVRKALEHRRMKEENIRLRESLEEMQGVELVGQSPPMQKVLEMVRTVAPTDTTVLITGESGTGKELVARAIHNLSPRRFMPLVVIHCGALTETLLESELFGHEKGAFTGAQYRKKGKFEVAEGGTVFLDEISDISLKTQTDLLRVLQEKEITRVGGTQTIKVDFRAIAATNRDLEAKVKEGTFRPDLFYRLNVFELRLPSLRERRDDIPLLADHFLRKYARAMNKRFTCISKPAVDLLMHYDWPGNVRELENAIERAMVIGREPEIQISDFPLQVSSGTQPPLGQTLEDVERAHILKVLEGCSWNQSLAARVLKIDRVTLYNKIKKYGFKKAGSASS